MLEYSDLRAKIPILFMSSGGMRLGGFAAHVVVYKGTDEEYDTFISPEAFQVYEEYRNLRIKFGEKITKKSPVLLRRFDINPDGKTASIDNTTIMEIHVI